MLNMQDKWRDDIVFFSTKEELLNILANPFDYFLYDGEIHLYKWFYVRDCKAVTGKLTLDFLANLEVEGNLYPIVYTKEEGQKNVEMIEDNIFTWYRQNKNKTFSLYFPSDEVRTYASMDEIMAHEFS